MYLIPANEGIVILFYRYVFYARMTQKINYMLQFVIQKVDEKLNKVTEDINICNNKLKWL